MIAFTAIIIGAILVVGGIIGVFTNIPSGFECLMVLSNGLILVAVGSLHLKRN